MKNILSVLILMIGVAVFGQTIPSIMKTELSEIAKQDSVLTIDNKWITIEEALENYKGKVTVIDLYAIWCGDCIKGFPKLNELQKNNPDVKFIFLSMDKSEEAWKEGIKKYNLIGDYFYMGNNWKNNFATYIDLNWIPRYLIFDQNGKIAKYYSVKADDPTVQITLDSLRVKI